MMKNTSLSFLTEGRISSAQPSARGFSLIELLIAVALVSVLTAVALPSYKRYVLKSHRMDAKNALLDLAARQERYYSVNQSYTNTASALGYSGTFPILVPSTNNASYAISVTLTLGTIQYMAAATPVGNQSSDGCGKFLLRWDGMQSIQNASLSAAECW